MQTLRAALLVALLVSPTCLADEKLFLEAWKRVQRTFYDKDMRGVDWPAVRDELLPAARAAATPEQESAVINRALARLGASHTYHFIPSQREYWELLDVFYPEGVPENLSRGRFEDGRVRYVGIGIVTRTIDGKVFALDVYDGAPAANAGIIVGDELISVNGEPWSDIDAFRGKADREVTVTIRRSKDGPTTDVLVVPKRLQPRSMFLRAMKKSAQVIEAGEKKIGYVRVRSYASESYQEQLASLLAGSLAECDALVLDLRGGWGGAQAQYMDLFGSLAPEVEFRMRSSSVWNSRSNAKTWDKPMAVLIDSDSRSGKEILAYAFKARNRATLVGTTTRGAVLGGTASILSDGSLLLVAVSDVRVEGRSLEGHGVEPDVRVERPIAYSAGDDPQLEHATELLATQLNQAKTIEKNEHRLHQQDETPISSLRRRKS